MGQSRRRPVRAPLVNRVNRGRTGHTVSVPETNEPTPGTPDPNDSRTWPHWMTLSVLLTGIVGLAVTVVLARG